MCTRAILVGGVCDLMNLENYSAKSFSRGNPQKISSSKIERYTIIPLSVADSNTGGDWCSSSTFLQLTQLSVLGATMLYVSAWTDSWC